MLALNTESGDSISRSSSYTAARFQHQTVCCAAICIVRCVMTVCLNAHNSHTTFPKSTGCLLANLAEGESQQRATYCNMLPLVTQHYGCGSLADDVN